MENRKKILFITFYFPPYNCIGAVRTGQTVKLLQDMGYDLKIITATKQKLSKNLEIKLNYNNVYYTNWIDINAPIYMLAGEQKIKNLKTSLSAKTFKSKVVNFLKNLYTLLFHIPDQHIGWYFNAKKEIYNIIKNEKWSPDIIYSSAQPYTSHIIAKSVATEFNIPWIAELRDLWSCNHYRKTHFIDKIIEKNTLSFANALVTVSNPLKQKLEETYSIPVYTIQNGFDREDFKNNIEKFNDNKIRILYTGSLYYGKRDPSKLFEAISLSNALREKVLIEFYGNNLGWVAELALKYNITKNVIANEAIARNEVLILQQKFDILLLLTWSDPSEKGILTGKFFEYIGSGSTILGMGAVDDIASSIINDEKFGIASNDIKIISDFLLNYKPNEYNNDIKNREKYDRIHQIQKLSKILDEHIKNKK